MTDRSSPWRPLLDGAEAEAARAAVRSIAADLARLVEGDPGRVDRYHGLEGWAGIALVLAYVEEARLGSDLELGPDLGLGAALDIALDRAADEIAGAIAIPALHGGFSGIGWLGEHLQGDEPEDEDDPGEALARSLHGFLSCGAQLFDYDLIGGLAGFGVWAAERGARPLGRESLELVVDRLADLAEEVPEGIAWRTVPRHLPEAERPIYPDGNFNLGVAHGAPGAIGLLGLAHELDVARTTCSRLLERAVPWLLARHLPLDSPSRFPYNVATGVDPKPTGLAWCYGDLGVAVALLGAARRVGRDDWEQSAIEIGLFAARRSPPDLASVARPDPGLCHGAAGNGHLFHRLFRATGAAEFAAAARAWFGRALALRDVESGGFGGFRQWDLDERGTMALCAAPGLLSGSAGIGLCLLAAVNDVAPAWDRLLLADIPPA